MEDVDKMIASLATNMHTVDERLQSVECVRDGAIIVPSSLVRAFLTTGLIFGLMALIAFALWMIRPIRELL